MTIYDFIFDKIYLNLDKFNDNLILEFNNFLNIDFIIKKISKILLCNNKSKFCNNCNDCNSINLNINNNILIINNLYNDNFNNFNYIKYIIDNNIYLLSNKSKFIFIYNTDLLSDKILNFIIKKSSEYYKYIRFIFIYNNIKNLKNYFKINYYIFKIENYDINFNINLLKNIFNKLDNKYIITALNLSDNSIIKSYLILNTNNWNNRLNFINLLKLNFLYKKSLLFIIDFINFNKIEIFNPMFWLLTLILDSIKYKNNFNICIKNIDSIYILKNISSLFSLNILNIILDKLIEYFYILNKNTNIDKSLILMKNILYIENIIN